MRCDLCCAVCAWHGIGCSSWESDIFVLQLLLDTGVTVYQIICVQRGDKAAALAGLLARHHPAASTSRPRLPAAHLRQLVTQRRPPRRPPLVPAARVQPSGMQA